jgi:hypothetical protein
MWNRDPVTASDIAPSQTSTDFYTPQQFAVWRLFFGAYLAFHFAQLVPHAVELFGAAGMMGEASLSPTASIFPNVLALIDHSEMALQAFLCLLVVGSCVFAVGRPYPRVISVLLWYGWAALFNRNVLISNPGLAYVGWLLLACSLVTVEPVLFKGKVVRQRLSTDVFPWLYWGAWALVALGYSLSGLHKLDSPSWVDGSALRHVLQNPLARDTWIVSAVLALPPIFLRLATWGALGLELAFFPLGLFWRTRCLFWFAMLGLHVSRGGTLEGEHSCACFARTRFPLSPHIFPLRSRGFLWCCYDTPVIPASCGGLGEKESERAAW